MKTNYILLCAVMIGLFVPTLSPNPISRAKLSSLKIAFASDRDGDFEIFIMDADGSHVQQITFNDYDDMWPSWSPDGTQIAFASEESGYSQIHIINGSGTNEVNLTHGETGYAPTWSPGGDKIVFVSGRINGIDDIYVMDVDGSNPINLTASAAPNALDQLPSWTLDGSQIIFRTTREWEPINRNYPGYDAYIMNTDGSDQHKLMFAGLELSAVSVSPDGSHMTYSIDRGHNHIYIANGDGSNAAIFSPDNFDPAWYGTPGEPPIETIIARDPKWSPLGDQIVFSIFTGRSEEIAIMDVDGSNFRFLTHARGGSMHPVWQPISSLDNRVQ